MKVNFLIYTSLLTGLLLVDSYVISKENGNKYMGIVDSVLSFFGKNQYELRGIDGPYVVGKQVYRITSGNQLEKTIVDRQKLMTVYVQNDSRDSFQVRLKDKIEKQPEIWETPDRIIAISDIEGNFEAFSSFLQSNQVIDSAYNWSFGKGHLVLNGDFVDRGHNVMAVLWLIYKLEDQAKVAGGRVHYILGNHEIMNFLGNFTYNDHKYVRAAQLISQKKSAGEAVKFMYSNKTEIGRWLRSKNVVEKISDYIFVHAGLSPKLLAYDLSIPRINSFVRTYWDIDLSVQPGPDRATHFLLGAEGPYWYRGFAMDYNDYKRITESELDKVLAYYKGKTIVYGHTVVSDIISTHNGKLVNIDLKHGLEKGSGKTKGIFIENTHIYKVDDLGNRMKL